MDLLELEGMKGALALEELCKEGRVFVWASPPCETYSVANWSNLTRMFHYREQGEGHPPRKDGSKYGLRAAGHARLVKIILGIMDEVKWGALENPTGGSEKQLYMLQWDAKKHKVNLCAYRWPYRKATTVWTQGLSGNLKGKQGMVCVEESVVKGQ